MVVALNLKGNKILRALLARSVKRIRPESKGNLHDQ